MKKLAIAIRRYGKTPTRYISFVLAAYAILASFGVLSLRSTLRTVISPGTVFKYDSAMPGQNGLIATTTKMGMKVETYPPIAGSVAGVGSGY